MHKQVFQTRGPLSPKKVGCHHASSSHVFPNEGAMDLHLNKITMLDKITICYQREAPNLKLCEKQSSSKAKRCPNWQIFE